MVQYFFKSWLLNKKTLNYFASEKGEYSYINQSLRKIEGEEKNIFLFDALSLICPVKVCNYKKKNTLLYFDEDHLSNHAALNIIAQEMLYFLNKIIFYLDRSFKVNNIKILGCLVN